MLSEYNVITTDDSIPRKRDTVSIFTPKVLISFWREFFTKSVGTRTVISSGSTELSFNCKISLSNVESGSVTTNSFSVSGSLFLGEVIWYEAGLTAIK